MGDVKASLDEAGYTMLNAPFLPSDVNSYRRGLDVVVVDNYFPLHNTVCYARLHKQEDALLFVGLREITVEDETFHDFAVPPLVGAGVGVAAGIIVGSLTGVSLLYSALGASVAGALIAHTIAEHRRTARGDNAILHIEKITRQYVTSSVEAIPLALRPAESA